VNSAGHGVCLYWDRLWTLTLTVQRNKVLGIDQLMTMSPSRQFCTMAQQFAPLFKFSPEYFKGTLVLHPQLLLLLFLNICSFNLETRNFIAPLHSNLEWNDLMDSKCFSKYFCVALFITHYYLVHNCYAANCFDCVTLLIVTVYLNSNRKIPLKLGSFLIQYCSVYRKYYRLPSLHYLSF